MAQTVWIKVLGCSTTIFYKWVACKLYGDAFLTLFKLLDPKNPERRILACQVSASSSPVPSNSSGTIPGNVGGSVGYSKRRIGCAGN